MDEFLYRYIPGFHNAQATKKTHPGVFDKFWSSTHAEFGKHWPIALTEQEVKDGLTTEEKGKIEHQVSECNYFWCINS